jgi:hypothetical protein
MISRGKKRVFGLAIRVIVDEGTKVEIKKFLIKRMLQPVILNDLCFID